MLQRSAIGKVAETLAVLVVSLIAVSAFIIYNEASNQLCMGCAGQEPSSSSTETISLFTNPNNTITVTGLGLCSSNCIYPSPYASATVTINATVPISTLAVYVNNTYEATPIRNPSTTTVACTTSPGKTCSVELGGSGYSNATFTTVTKNYATCSVPQNATTCVATATGAVNTMTNYAYLFKGSVPTQFIPVVKGFTYFFKFVATFQDGSTATASASTIAS